MRGVRGHRHRSGAYRSRARGPYGRGSRTGRLPADRGLRQDAERARQALKEELAAATATAGDTPVAELARTADELHDSYARERAAGAGLHAAREALSRAEREYERRRAEHRRPSAAPPPAPPTGKHWTANSLRSKPS
ncbi:hypothetical protein SRIMM317S_03170 [Streptomyces rimosus subsp. rimosus]